MKKLLMLGGALGLALVLVLGTALKAAAQEGDKQEGDRNHSEKSWGDRAGFGMGPMGRMKEKLGLTDDQAAKVKELFKRLGEETKPLREQAKIDMDTLRLKVDSKAPDSEIKKILEALTLDRKKMEEGRKKLQDQLALILTPTQRAKMIMRLEERGGKMMKGMGGRRMGGGGGPEGEKAKDEDM